jgi:hypothetical protein
MKRLWPFVLVALISLCLGAALDEAMRTVRNRQSRARDRDGDEVFQQRVRCKSLADDFVKKSSDDSTTLFLERVEFSSARHSCIGAFMRVLAGKRGTVYSYEAIDILTGEALYSGTCVGNDANSRIFCGNGRDMELTGERNKTFADALSSKE